MDRLYPQREAEEPSEVIFSREACGCFARKHGLVGNCVDCGRVACELEGEGPCVFCGNEMYRRGARRVDDSEELRRAEKHKAKLLANDRADMRKKVVDDDVDWYELERDVWLDDGARKEAAKKGLEEAMGLAGANRAVVIDFDDKGNLITRLDRPDLQKEHKEAQEFLQNLGTSSSGFIRAPIEESGSAAEVAAEISALFKPKNEAKNPESSGKTDKLPQKNQTSQPSGQTLDSNNEKPESRANKTRGEKTDRIVQHEEEETEFTEESPIIFDRSMFDEKSTVDFRLLSVPVVNAGLIVSGLRGFEGKNFSSNFRGPLLIYAGSGATAQPRDLLELLGTSEPPMPGCVVGVVDLQAVWPIELFKERAPAELHKQVQGSHVFVLRNPRLLDVPIKISGPVKEFADPGRELALRALSLSRKVPLNSTHPAAAFERELLEDETQILMRQMGGCVVGSSRGNGFEIARLRPDPLEATLRRIDKDLGRSLRLGYDNRKRVSLAQYSELLFPVWFLCKKFGEKTGEADQIAIDVIRLGKGTSPINFQRNYFFACVIGNTLTFQNSIHPNVNFQLPQNSLVAFKSFVLIDWQVTPHKNTGSLPGTAEYSSVLFAAYTI